MVDYTKPHPREDWDEDIGISLWWIFPITEPPYVGSPLDDQFPEYVTHFTKIIEPEEIKTFEENKTMWDKLLWRLDVEGFEYGLNYYSTFDEVQDEEFHKLKRAYKKSFQELQYFLGHKALKYDLQDRELYGVV